MDSKKVQKKKLTFKNNIYITLIIMATLFMGIGHAAISAISLDINGLVTATPQDGIFITAAISVYDSVDVNDDNSIGQVNVSTGTFLNTTSILPNDNSFITYSVTIYNSTEEDYMFEGTEYILGEGTYDNEYIIFDSLNGISEGYILNSKESITFTITFHYKDYISVDNKELNSSLNFKFNTAVISEDLLLMKTSETSTDAFWNYRSKIKTITFENEINIPSEAVNFWDVSATGNDKVMAYIVKNEENTSYYDLYIQGDGKIYANYDSEYLFYDFVNVDTINNIYLLNTHWVTDMSYMFYNLGEESTVFTLDLGNNFDTSNVTDMTRMFYHTGYSSELFTLNLGDKFDTSKVTIMDRTFAYCGYSSPKFELDLGDNFNTENVTDMARLFSYAGYLSEIFTLDLGDKFDTKNVINMNRMFYYSGNNNKNFTLSLGDKFNTINVTDMYAMFEGVGYSSTIFTLDLGDNFNTENVTDMGSMFANAGYSSDLFYLDCRSWNVSNVTNSTNFNLNVETKVIAPSW